MMTGAILTFLGGSVLIAATGLAASHGSGRAQARQVSVILDLAGAAVLFSALACLLVQFGIVTGPLPALSADFAIDEVRGGVQTMQSVNPLSAIYLLGVFIMAAWFARDLLAVARLTRTAFPVRSGPWADALETALLKTGHPGRTTLLASDQIRSPASAMPGRRLIFVPAANSSDPTFAVSALMHELLHLERRDWLRTVAIRLALCFAWPNPLMWRLSRLSMMVREEAVDEAVCAAGTPRPVYAQMLLAFIRVDAARSSPLVNPASGKRGLERRLRRIAETGEREFSIVWIVSACGLVAAMALATSAAISPPRPSADPAEFRQSRDSVDEELGEIEAMLARYDREIAAIPSQPGEVVRREWTVD